MIFGILAAVGLVGIIGTLWLSRGHVRSIEHPIPYGSEWFAFSLSRWEYRIQTEGRMMLRELLKDLIVWLVLLYRKLATRMPIKKIAKKHIRAFLSDQTPHPEIKTSAFLNEIHPESTGSIDDAPENPHHDPSLENTERS